MAQMSSFWVCVGPFFNRCVYKITCLTMKVLVCNLCLTRIKRKQKNKRSSILMSVFGHFLVTRCGFISLEVSDHGAQSSAEANSSGILAWHPDSGDILGSIHGGADRTASSRLVIVKDFPPRHVTTRASSRHHAVCQTSLAATALAGK